MNAVLTREPYRLPAGLLAALVHALFFSLLYFSFSWQSQPAASMSVELWDSIPQLKNAAPLPAPPPPAERVEMPPPKPVVTPQTKPDIVMPDKKKPEAKPVAVPQKARVQPAQSSILERQLALEEAARAEQAAATGRVVDEYTAKIIARIRSRIVMPPGVPDEARAEFRVTLLPGGEVLNVRLVKSSGFRVYDDAVERAIIKAQPLPLPSDSAMFNRFREMKLGFRPKEEG
jgi:colicin import membrane protein